MKSLRTKNLFHIELKSLKQTYPNLTSIKKLCDSASLRDYLHIPKFHIISHKLQFIQSIHKVNFHYGIS